MAELLRKNFIFDRRIMHVIRIVRLIRLKVQIYCLRLKIIIDLVSLFIVFLLLVITLGWIFALSLVEILEQTRNHWLILFLKDLRILIDLRRIARTNVLKLPFIWNFFLTIRIRGALGIFAFFVSWLLRRISVCLRPIVAFHSLSFFCLSMNLRRSKDRILFLLQSLDSFCVL